MAEQRKLRLNSGGAEQVDSGGAEQIAQCDGRGGGNATRMAKANDEGTIDSGGDE